MLPLAAGEDHHSDLVNASVAPLAHGWRSGSSKKSPLAGAFQINANRVIESERYGPPTICRATRRFSRRPSAVGLSAIGFALP